MVPHFEHFPRVHLEVHVAPDMNKKRYNMCKKDFGPDGGGGDVEVHSKPRMMLVGTCGYMQNIIFIYHIYYYIIYIIYIYHIYIIYIYIQNTDYIYNMYIN